MRVNFADKREDQELFIAIYHGWTRGGELQGKEQLAVGNEVTRKLLDLAHIEGNSVRLREGGGDLEFSPREARLFRAHFSQARFPTALGPAAGKVFEMIEAIEG